MAGKLDFFELMNVIPSTTRPSFSENDKSVRTLIHVHSDTIKKAITDSVEILLQKDPEIKCSFTITYSTEWNVSLRARIKFKSNVPYNNLKYKASLYAKRPGYDLEKFTFLEDLNMEDIREESVFYFSRPIKYHTHHTHFYLICQITRKENNFVPLKVENPKREITKDLLLLYKNQILTDLKIICQGKEFSTHKLLLAGRSPVFQAMFQQKINESEEKEIEITDFEPEIVEHLLTFIYTDAVEDLKEGQAEKLLAAADKYALDNLKLICMKEIAKSVKDVQEAFDVLAIAEHHNVPGLRNNVLDFVQKNAKKS